MTPFFENRHFFRRNFLVCFSLGSYLHSLYLSVKRQNDIFFYKWKSGREKGGWVFENKKTHLKKNVILSFPRLLVCSRFHKTEVSARSLEVELILVDAAHVNCYRVGISLNLLSIGLIITLLLIFQVNFQIVIKTF